MDSQLAYYRAAVRSTDPAGVGVRNACLLAVFCCLVAGLFSLSVVLLLGCLQGQL